MRLKKVLPRHTLSCWVALATLLAVLPVTAAESVVRIDDRIDGKLMLPGGEVKAAVVLYHGFNGSMDEVGQLYEDLAGRLAERGLASLRINFNGEGPHGNYVVTSTLQSRVSEAKAAFEYLRTAVPAESYGAVGFSLGGLTTMAVIGDEPDWFDSVVLWSAAASMRLNADPAYNEAASKAILEGRASYTAWTEITLTREFLASFIGVDVSPNLQKYEGSLLSLRGTNDFLPALDQQWLASSPSRDKQAVQIGDADHIFNVLDEPKPNYSDRVLKMTADWLQRTLVNEQSAGE